MTGGVAVLGDARTRDDPAVSAALRAHGGEAARWFAPCDADDLQRAVMGGEIATVIARGEVLWPVIWEGRVRVDLWPATVRLIVPGQDGDTDAAARALARTWQAWHVRQRRRRAVAGLILSALALGAALVIGLQPR